jgi:hypothetical protein
VRPGRGSVAIRRLWPLGVIALLALGTPDNHVVKCKIWLGILNQHRAAAAADDVETPVASNGRSRWRSYYASTTGLWFWEYSGIHHRHPNPLLLDSVWLRWSAGQRGNDQALRDNWAFPREGYDDEETGCPSILSTEPESALYPEGTPYEAVHRTIRPFTENIGELELVWRQTSVLDQESSGIRMTGLAEGGHNVLLRRP